MDKNVEKTHRRYLFIEENELKCYLGNSLNASLVAFNAGYRISFHKYYYLHGSIQKNPE